MSALIFRLGYTTYIRRFHWWLSLTIVIGQAQRGFDDKIKGTPINFAVQPVSLQSQSLKYVGHISIFTTSYLKVVCSRVGNISHYSYQLCDIKIYTYEFEFECLLLNITYPNIAIFRSLVTKLTKALKPIDQQTDFAAKRFFFEQIT